MRAGRWLAVAITVVTLGAVGALWSGAFGYEPAEFRQSADVVGASVRADDLELLLLWETGPCGRPLVAEAVLLEERVDSVSVDVEVTFSGSKPRLLRRLFERGRPCTMEGMVGCSVVRLRAPLGERDLLELSGAGIGIGERRTRDCEP